MRAIAKEAGVSAASVVVHFKNKIALMEAALVEDIERTLDRAFVNMPVEGDLTQRMSHLWQTMYTFYDGNRNLYRQLLSSTVFSIEEDTPYMTSQAESFFDFLGNMIEKEKAEGRMDDSVDGHILSITLFSQYFGVLIMFFRDPAMTPGMATELIRAMTRQTLTAIERH